PYTGGAIAVAEAARNVVCTGALPVAVTDCLNFGNPEKPEVYYTLEHAIRGIAEACLQLETPVVSGNVSLYNEAGGRPVYPTPIIGMLGLLEDVERHLTAGFTLAGARAILLGAGLEQPAASLAGSEYLEAVHGQVAGMPSIDLALERRLQQLVLRAHAEGLLLSAHDCAEGGLAVALAECAILGGLGFEGSAELSGRLDAALFGEAQSRIVVTIAPDTYRSGGGLARLEDLARELQVPVTVLGTVTAEPRFRFGPIDAPLEDLRRAYEALLDA
ncbi:AIR synthase related protein, partial [Tepidiforma sp.]|uniref:AIR synthase related protein n=1 Tax=Tepidiforma sp. TaxID=2682230 RepID=UPI002ADDD5C3